MPALTSMALALAASLAWAGDGDPPKDGTPRKRNPGEYGPFFEAEAPSDAQPGASMQRGDKPMLSVGKGAFCFVDGSWCRASLLISAGVAAGMRVPASNAGPDVPYSQFNVHGGFVVRPMMYAGRTWHPWGLGVVGSWSRGTGSVTVKGSSDDTEVGESKRTDATRIALLNQIWLSKKPHGLHLDLSLGVVRSAVLDSGVALWGTHAEIGFGIGGWATLFAGGDFLDRDARVMLGMRAHGIAAGPLIALALAGMALGGAL
ncbi:MAG: hypothetical protein JNK45_30800 [Myxococcales bacterium]|nr:hypothetical protein [Myxococcales bacterium]